MITITDRHKPALGKMGVLAREMMDIRAMLRGNDLAGDRLKELQKALAEKQEAYEAEKAIIFKK